MKKVSINIGKKSYRCECPENDVEMIKGLSKREFLPPDEGMIFNFIDSLTCPTMWMKDTLFALDMIGINEDGVVIKKVKAKPESEELIPFPGCVYVLEVSSPSKIRVGDDFEFDLDDDLDRFVMKVLAPDGSAQGLLQGGERIFSRVSTRKLIKRAKTAYEHSDKKELYEKDCKKLGKYVFEELYDQDHRDQQYVELPD